MSLPKYLHPKTFWEHRCELLEEAFLQLMERTVRYLPYFAREDFQQLNNEYGRLLGEIAAKFPPPGTER